MDYEFIGGVLFILLIVFVIFRIKASNEKRTEAENSVLDQVVPDPVAVADPIPEPTPEPAPDLGPEVDQYLTAALSAPAPAPSAEPDTSSLEYDRQCVEKARAVRAAKAEKRKTKKEAAKRKR